MSAASISLLPLSLSAWSGDKETFRSHLSKLLVDLSADSPSKGVLALNQVDETGLSLLHLLILRGTVDLALALISVGANPNVRESRLQQTPLHFALARGQLLLAKSLLETHGERLDIHAIDVAGRTALHYAASKGASECVSLLIQLGAFIDAADYQGWTAMHLATSLGKLSVVKVLSSKKANVNQVSALGYSSLHIAIAQRRDDAAELLAGTLGAEVNAPSTDGETPLRSFASWSLM